MSEELLSAFDDCLHDLDSGVGIDEALSRYPAELAAELRPMLEAAQFARLPQTARPRPEAEFASRARFLSLAREARGAQKRSLWAWLFGSTPAATRRRSFALQLGSLVFIGGVILGSVVTVNAAGSALPGDLLYGIKLAVEDTQLALSPAPASRQALEAQFEERRLEEAQQLLAAQREATITFTGEIQVIEGERWVVSGIPVHVPGTLSQGFAVGESVRITGRSDGTQDAIVAERVERLGVPTLVPTLPALTETPRPTSTPQPSATSSRTETAEPTETQEATQTVAPVATRTPAATATVATVALPTATQNVGPAPTNTPKVDDHGGATHTPEAEDTEEPDDEDEDSGGSQATVTAQPTDDHSGSGGGSQITNTPRPTDDHSGSGGGGDDNEPTKTPKP